MKSGAAGEAEEFGAPLAVRLGRFATPVRVGSLLAVSLALQFYVVSTHRVPVNSDQAVVGLMARHILEGKGHPVFYYGATYAGSLEPHYVAAVFAVLGATMRSYHLAMAGLVLLTIVGVYALSRWRFGPVAGLVALGYLCVPPFFFLYKGLTSDGHYNSFNLITLGVLAVALGIDVRLRQGRRAAILFATLGFLMGLGFWVNPITPAVDAAALSWLWVRRRPRPFPCMAFVTLAGAIVGSAPWWIWNVRHGWASLKASELGVSSPGRILASLGGLVWTSLPTLAGGMTATPDPLLSRLIFPFSREIALLTLALLAAATLTRLERGRALPALVLLALVLVSALSSRLVLSEPRFLFPYYVLIAPLAGAAVSTANGRGERLLAAIACSAALALNLASLAAAPVNLRLDDKEVTGSLDPLIARLERAGLDHIYSNYWTAYRISFESGERIVATPIPGDQLVRYAPYLEAVNGAPDAAVVLLPPRDGCFEAYLREKEMPFSRTAVGNFGVYSGLPAQVLGPIRSGSGLPLPASAYRVSWQLGPQPQGIEAGASRSVRATVSNRGPCIWPPGVHLSYHWWPLESGLPSIYDGDRGFLRSALDPGQSETVTAELVAPSSAGRYRLEYDMVHELVTWFSKKGAQTVSVEVDVRPSGTVRKR